MCVSSKKWGAYREREGEEGIDTINFKNEKSRLSTSYLIGREKKKGKKSLEKDRKGREGNGHQYLLLVRPEERKKIHAPTVLPRGGEEN